METKPEPKVSTNPQAAQLIENTESVVHQTFKDVNDIGEVADDTKADVGTLLKEFRQFKSNYKLEMQTEIERQIKPLRDDLEKLTTNKPKFIFVLPNLPRWVKFILRIK